MKAAPRNQLIQHFVPVERKFCEAINLYSISDKLELTSDLKCCFPATYKMILLVAYYLILEDSNPLFRFGKWASLDTHLYERDIPSQRSSELFADITEDAKMKFFHLQGRRCLENEYFAYDTSSISSYSEQLSVVKYGKNKDHDPLPQVNLLLVF